MVLIRATRTAISALISASICFGAVEAQDHAAASGQKQTMLGGGRDDQTLADKQSSEISATKRADEQSGEAQILKSKSAIFAAVRAYTNRNQRSQSISTMKFRKSRPKNRRAISSAISKMAS